MKTLSLFNGNIPRGISSEEILRKELEKARAEDAKPSNQTRESIAATEAKIKKMETVLENYFSDYKRRGFNL